MGVQFWFNEGVHLVHISTDPHEPHAKGRNSDRNAGDSIYSH
jgi:hypothetical protein